jgi:hypothetical protein
VRPVIISQQQQRAQLRRRAHLARLVKGPITVLKPSTQRQQRRKKEETRARNAALALSLINNYMREGVEPEIYSLLWFPEQQNSNPPKPSSPFSLSLPGSAELSLCVFLC